MRGEQCDVVLDEVGDDAALRGVGCDAADAAQQQRMVHKQQVRLQLHGLGSGLEHGIHCEQDPAHGSVRLACHQADGIPALGAIRRPQPLDRGPCFSKRSHALIL